MVKNKKGLTLIEIIVVMAVAAIVLTPLTMLMATSLSNSSRISQSIDADQSTHQSLIVLNEAVRGAGFSGLTYLDDYHGYGQALIVNTRVFFMKDRGFVMQNYNSVSEDLASEYLMNTFVDHIEILLDSEKLEIAIHIDKDSDGLIEDVYPYVYSKRD